MPSSAEVNEETRTWVVIIESPFFKNKPVTVINGRLPVIDEVSIYERFARERVRTTRCIICLDDAGSHHVYYYLPFIIYILWGRHATGVRHST